MDTNSLLFKWGTIKPYRKNQEFVPQVLKQVVNLSCLNCVGLNWPTKLLNLIVLMPALTTDDGNTILKGAIDVSEL